MDIYLSHKTALDFWHSCTSLDGYEIASKRAVTSAYAGADCVDRFGLHRFVPDDAPMHVLVGQEKQRRNSKACQSHIVSRRLPRGSLYKIAAHVYVTSPELTIMQVMHDMEIVELMKLVCEFCGTYRILPRGRGSLYDDVKPLTSLSELAAFGKRFGAASYEKHLEKAVRHSFDGSGSSMETKLALLLTLPRYMGGYALPRPELNVSMPIPPAFRWQVGKSSFRCDLYWRSEGIAIEYDSDEEHAASVKILEDALRRNILESKRIRMLTVTKRQVYSLSNLNVLAEEVRLVLRVRDRNTGVGVMNRRRELHEAVMMDESHERE